MFLQAKNRLSYIDEKNIQLSKFQTPSFGNMNYFLDFRKFLYERIIVNIPSYEVKELQNNAF